MSGMSLFEAISVDLELAAKEIKRLEDAIRHHRDQRGDDRCWQDDEELYRVLPEGFTPPTRDSAVELANCQRYIACRHNPGTVYVSPEREIERLRAIVARLPSTADGEIVYADMPVWILDRSTKEVYQRTAAAIRRYRIDYAPDEQTNLEIGCKLTGVFSTRAAAEATRRTAAARSQRRGRDWSRS